MPEKNIDKILSNIKDIPTLPSVVLHVNRALSEKSSTIESVSKIIEKDPALTSKVLKLANSSYYGLTYHVDTLSRAVIILGFNTVRNIAVTISLLDIFNKSRTSFDIKGLWQHSLGCAVAAKALTHKKHNPALSEKAFIGGILHDIGKLIIYTNFPREMDKIIAKAENNNHSMSEAEEEILGFNHAEIGSLVSKKWHFPADLSETIRFHNNPEREKKFPEVVYAVHAGNEIAKALKLGTSPYSKVQNINTRTWDVLEIADKNFMDEDLYLLLMETKKDFDDVVNSWTMD
ncbi:MAG: HDOD domain-containing protein [Nitrospirae bacterium]|nr:HDOD domain-containing protein [Nitrospirota bacterium]